MTKEKYDKHGVGEFGEKAAAKYLKKKKYKIIAKNKKAGRSEIDIIALNKDTLVFVEVKTRTYDPDKTYYTRPADAVNKSKTSYLIRGADRFCAENGTKFSRYFKRFDVIEVYLEQIGNRRKVNRILHFENAVSRNK